MGKKVLMVCLGNICRSPLAEGILKSKKTSDTIVDSAGTGAWHVGNLPDLRSISVAEKHGIDITDQRARQFKESDLDEFDFIYVMDRSNYNNVLSMCVSKAQCAKVKLILNEIEENNAEVPDPYYGEGDGFERVYQMLDLACDKIVEKHQL